MLAHSANSAGQTHDLRSHLHSVAELAARFAAKWNAQEMGYWAGLWHDVGKLHPAFQAYLQAADAHKRGPDHKSAGALLAEQYMPPLAWVVAGHHGGLHAKSELKAWLTERATLPAVQEVLRRLPGAIPEAVPKERPAFPAFVRSPTEAEFLIRMVYSALVDADRLDTAAHFAAVNPADLISPTNLASLWERFENDQSKLLADTATTPVNQVRREIYEACLMVASLPPGFFRLTVPTGGGKTRAAMAFALRHALCHGLQRVIVAIPYTSIVEQTARTYRSIFGPQHVLEHHSAAVESVDSETPSPDEQWAKLATENWDAPLIVTTTVQLFESLHADWSSRCRKLHNIAGSVLILDEVQTLPLELLEPIAEVLRELVSHYGVTVVFSSATQPALTGGPFSRLPGVREMCPNAASLFERLKRVHFQVPARAESWTWEQVATIIRGERQVLTVVNTKRDAMDLLSILNDPDVLHLSTQMCGAHRLAVLDEARNRLATGEPCRLVSTQVIEAGVDIDFPVVLRALGPLDRIVQAAGRCNREGRLHSGTCIVFRPADGHLPPGSYRTATAEAEQIFADPACDLHDPGIFDRYFQRLYQDVKLDQKGVMKLREALDYPEVARRFRMIPEETTTVVVRYPPHKEAVDLLISEIQGRPPRFERRVLRQLHPYLVSIPSRLTEGYAREGLLNPLIPGLWRWSGNYDMQRGLVGGNPDPTDLIW